MPQKEMTADKLAALIAQWQSDPRQLQKMAQLSRAAAILNATDRVVSECKALI
jgi:UDP-N-acetylglucosamine--N-acetylmuramyl-(pentapeptide) pyrophosphoryl-undecaprenol N-acetylglucosamine transferase